MKLRALLLLLVCYGTASSAAEPLQLPMKLDYAEGVIMRSKSAERIEQSDSEEAKAKLQEARDKYKAARQAQSDGDFARAEQLANEAIKLVTAAAMRVPNKIDEETVQRRRYDELHAQIETYRNWDHQNSELDAATQAEMDNAILEIEKAASYAATKDYAKANEFLSMALNIVIKAKNSSLKERTFSYDLNFETPLDEYKYELSRNDDYLRLIPIALTQKEPSAGVRSLLERFVEKARVLRHDAESRFEEKQFEQAVTAMQQSTNELVNGLKIVGVR
jgi:tetratricopeptide (TPR) repeat protein